MADEPQLPTLMDVREKLQLIDHSRLAVVSTPDSAGKPVQEYVLQDFVCFHGAFARTVLDDDDWAKLCNLMDPASPEFALTSEHARVAWTFEYRVHVPVA
ncbi:MULTISPECIES: hypothetical protein [Bifidobacterium]|uniref:hypothetical protein n=1 Tax=Bifidobacterium TaxID=1678 RepID=UPI002353CC71|nr:hypothetical protein [Bifidobacterium tibiigranuli]MCI1211861.1 hypothetical protein [Bifidobacterium tibiigranuli]MCI1222144.1 hypothetical protein [Bifidobacterium tibiigranuli]